MILFQSEDNNKDDLHLNSKDHHQKPRINLKNLHQKVNNNSSNNPNQNLKGFTVLHAIEVQMENTFHLMVTQKDHFIACIVDEETQQSRV